MSMGEDTKADLKDGSKPADPHSSNENITLAGQNMATLPSGGNDTTTPATKAQQQQPTQTGVKSAEV